MVGCVATLGAILRYMRTMVNTMFCAIYYDLRDDYSYMRTTTDYIRSGEAATSLTMHDSAPADRALLQGLDSS